MSLRSAPDGTFSGTVAKLAELPREARDGSVVRVAEVGREYRRANGMWIADVVGHDSSSTPAVAPPDKSQLQGSTPDNVTAGGLGRSGESAAAWVGGILLIGLVVIAGSILVGLAALAMEILFSIVLWIGIPVGVLWALIPMKRARHQRLSAVLGEVLARLFAICMAALFAFAALKSFGNG